MTRRIWIGACIALFALLLGRAFSQNGSPADPPGPSSPPGPGSSPSAAKIPITSANSSADPTLDGELKQAVTLQTSDQYQQEYDYLTALPAPSSSEQAIKIGSLRAEILADRLKRDYELSNQILTDLIKKYPKDPFVYIPEWRIAHNLLISMPPAQRDPRKAQDLLKNLLSDFPQTDLAPQFKLDFAMSYYAQKDFANAAQRYRQYAEESLGQDTAIHRQPFMLYMLGDCYYRMNRISEAQKAWLTLEARYPDDSWATGVKMRLSNGTPIPISSNDSTKQRLGRPSNPKPSSSRSPSANFPAREGSK